MKHARPDYDRIQDPALSDPSLLPPGCIPIAADEPVFLLRAQDKTAAEVVRYWAELNANGDQVAVSLALDQVERMEAWPIKKQADVP